MLRFSESQDEGCSNIFGSFKVLHAKCEPVGFNGMSQHFLDKSFRDTAGATRPVRCWRFQSRQVKAKNPETVKTDKLRNPKTSNNTIPKRLGDKGFGLWAIRYTLALRT